MSLPETVRQCLEAFNLDDCEPSGSNTAVLSFINDERGRFRIWAGNISAHRTGRRSLQYRLRDSSNLVSTVQSLLSDLLGALSHLSTLVLDSPAHDAYQDSDVLHEEIKAARVVQSPDHAHVDGDDSDESLFELDDKDLTNASPLQQAMDEVHEVINCLLRFSMALRNPARHDLVRQSATSNAVHFQPFYADYVRSKYPTAPDFLVQRLGKATAAHRQYFQYREAHHTKLVEGLDDHDEHGTQSEKRPSTLASSLPQSYHQSAAVPELESEVESVYTATSYASSFSESLRLRPPPMPQAGLDGDPFECPICYGIIVASNDRSWREHVFEDLPPYVCTYEECGTAHRPFARRRDWQQHESKMHNREWICPLSCGSRMATADLFEQHLRSEHSDHEGIALLTSVSSAYSQSRDARKLGSCVMCGKEKPTLELMSKHVGQHLEQLALFSLPSYLLDEGSDLESGAEELDVSVSDKEMEGAIDEEDHGVQKSGVPSEWNVAPVETGGSSRTLLQSQSDGSDGEGGHGHQTSVSIPDAGFESNFRSLTQAEAWSLYHFESHARQCSDCYNPAEVHLENQELCAAGDALAQDVAVHVYRKDGEVYGRESQNYGPIRVEIPRGYGQVVQLLETQENPIKGAGQLRGRRFRDQIDSTGDGPLENRHRSRSRGARRLSAGGRSLAERALRAVGSDQRSVGENAQEDRVLGATARLKPSSSNARWEIDFDDPERESLHLDAEEGRRSDDVTSTSRFTDTQSFSRDASSGRDALQVDVDNTRNPNADAQAQSNVESVHPHILDVFGEDTSKEVISSALHLAQSAWHQGDLDRAELHTRRAFDYSRVHEEKYHKKFPIQVDISSMLRAIQGDKDEQRALEAYSRETIEDINTTTVDSEVTKYDNTDETRMDPESRGAAPTIMERSDSSQSSPESPASEKKHRCPYCSMEFARHHNLNSHLLTHSQEMPFVCQECQARFRRLHDLKRHTKLHTGERPHTCDECGRQFSSAEALARHGKDPDGCPGTKIEPDRDLVEGQRNDRAKLTAGLMFDENAMPSSGIRKQLLGTASVGAKVASRKRRDSLPYRDETDPPFPGLM